ncbi:methionyl-tRNA formyltransferase [Mycoplasma sp. Mirounga ES2805-ORL]|uniref:methionyl-tRNA formyltransferase n=1 Tax=Mycoplasma sp. Mirounga ES2805-ORL TaxID=754514 RepID=UPI00197BFEE4|nr:methionyl-tRNA formyltransferase [Mycoplasma sp. Mirounga ES2805-ORL]QSF13385.1 methionyl-tRNA formyltransferase [Mycoplasma sp. Mirounga ES2805-ORL]
MKIVLAGTPQFSVPIFEEIINNFDVVAIVSQPDKRAIRGNHLEPTPTKLLARKYNIKLFQPEKIKEIYSELEILKYDYLITCAFGQFIPESVLKLAKKKNLNIHGSLLPKYRGAAPIQYSLLNNDAETGICLMEMIKSMDAGDVFSCAKIKIDKRDTSDSLFLKLQELAKNNIVTWIKDLEDNKLTPQKQDESLVILSPKLNKADGELIPKLKKQEAFNIIRAFSSNPGAFTFINNKRVKIYYASEDKKPNSLELNFSDGKLFATEYQFESKKRIKLD